MATASDLRTYLMRFVGVQVATHLTANAGKNAAVMTAVNQALDEILKGRQQQTVAELVKAPESVTVGAVTAGSKAITFSGFTDDQLGCAIVINGDSQVNRLVKNDSATLALEKPFLGTSATNVPAVVYHDVVNLTVRVQSTLGPILCGGRVLTLLSTPADLVRVRQPLGTGLTVNPTEMTVPSYCLLRDAITYGQQPLTRVQFDTRPMTQCVPEFTAVLTPPQITSWDDARPAYLPGNLDESVLKPWALYKLSKDPDFTGDAGQAQTAWLEAKATWDAYNPRAGALEVIDLYGVGEG